MLTSSFCLKIFVFVELPVFEKSLVVSVPSRMYVVVCVSLELYVSVFLSELLLLFYCMLGNVYHVRLVSEMSVMCVCMWFQQIPVSVMGHLILLVSARLCQAMSPSWELSFVLPMSVV